MGNSANAAQKLDEYPVLSDAQAKEFDYILLVDQSSSMDDPSTVIEGGSKWDEAKEFTRGFAHYAEQHDDDGITLIKFSSAVKSFDGVKAAAVDDMFQKERPHGTTNLGKALEAAFAKKLSTTKKAIIVCITDGTPDSRSAVESAIVNVTRKIEDATQINLLFVQIGNDSGAAQFLDHLDNSLTGAKYDVVNTMNAVDAGALSMEQLICQAVNH